MVALAAAPGLNGCGTKLDAAAAAYRACWASTVDVVGFLTWLDSEHENLTGALVAGVAATVDVVVLLALLFL